MDNEMVEGIADLGAFESPIMVRSEYELVELVNSVFNRQNKIGKYVLPESL